MKSERKFLLLFLAVAASIWVLDAALDAAFLPGASFSAALAAGVPAHQLWARLVSLAGLALFGLLASRLVSRRCGAQPQMRRERHEFDQVFDAAADGMCVIDKDLNVVRVSTPLAGLLGRKIRDLEGKKCCEVFPVGECGSPRCTLARIAAGETRVEAEIERRRPDGSRVFYTATATALTGPAGELAGIVKTFRDTTPQRRAEEALRRAQAVETAVFGTIPAAVFGLKERKIVFAGRGVKEVFGWESKELMGKSTRVLFCSDEDYARKGTEFYERMAADGVCTAELVAPRKDGSLITCMMTAVEVGGEAGDVDVVAVTLDISDRKRAEEALDQSERKYRELFEGMSEGVAFHDMIYDDNGKPVDYVTTEVNPQYCKLLGRTPEETIGRHGSELYGPEEPRLCDICNKVVETGEPASFEVHLPSMDRYLAASVGPSKGGKFTTILHDITERTKALEQAEYLNRLLAAIRDVNQLITREKDPARLLAEVCRTIVSTRGYSSAWIVTLEGAGTAGVLFSHGANGRFERLAERFREGQLCHCVECAIEQGDVVVIDEPAAVCGDCPLARECVNSMAVRIGHTEGVFGVLRVVTPSSAWLEPPERELLLEVAGDIGFALHDISLERERRAAAEELKETRALAFAILEAMPQVVFGLCEGRIVWASRTAAEVFGWESRELVGKDIRLLHSSDEDYEAMLEEYYPLDEKGDGHRSESVCLNKSGEEVLCAVRVRRVEGKPKGLDAVACYGDIRGVRETERELKESRRMLSTLMSNLPGMVYRRRRDDEWTIEFVSEGSVELVGLRPDELVGESTALFDDAIHKEDWDAVASEVKEALKTKRPYQLLYRMTAPGGRLKWVWEQGRAVYSQEGDVTATEGFMQDITELKEAQEGLARSERDLSVTMANLPGVAYRCNGKTWAMDFVSEGAWDLLGCAPCEITGKPAKDTIDAMIHREDRQQALDSIYKAVREKTPWQLVYRLRDARGKLKWIWEQGRGTYAPDGELEMMHGFIADATELKETQDALAESRRMLATLLSNLPGMVYRCQADNWVTEFVSDGCLKLTGYRPEELVGRPMAETFDLMLHPEDRQWVMDSVDAALRQKTPLEMIYRWITRGGKQKWIWEQGRGIYGPDGQLVATEGFVTDVSELKETQNALAESRRMLATLLSNLPGMVYRNRHVGDGLWNIEFVSDGCLALMGRPPEYFVGKDTEAFNEVLHPEDREEVLALIKEALDERKEPYEYVCRVVTPEGGQKWVWERGRGIYSPEGERLVMEGFITDITELKETQEALAAERERLAVTLESIGDGVMATDERGAVLLMNKVAEDLTGWAAAEAAARPLEEVFRIIDEKTRRARENPIEKVISSGVVQDLGNDTVLISKDGSERVIADSASPIRDRQGRFIGAVLVFRDETDKRLMEQELARAERLESLGVLAGGIAHDFNNLLTAVLGNLSLARMRHDQFGKAQEIDDAEAAVVKAKNLTRQLLTFAKGGAPVKEAASMKELLEDTVSFALRGASVKCEFAFAGDLWDGEIDTGQVSQVVHNLALNALQAMPDGGALTVGAENFQSQPGSIEGLVPGRYVRIWVADQGEGIPAEVLPRIFDPYYTTKQDGTGLGLAVAYSVVTRHGGRIEVNARLGEGSTFTVYLPAAETAGPSRPEKPGGPEISSAALLLVDDDEMVRETVAEILAQLGYEVTAVSDGKQAVRAYRESMEKNRRFDAVIMDLTVPGGMGGRQALEKLREIDPAVKAVVSSGYSNDPVMSDYRKYGFSGFLPKPFTIEQLARVIRGALTGDDKVGR